MSVSLTTAYKKLKALNKRYRIIQGGAGASKTYSILILLFEYAYTNPRSKITIITSTFPLLTDGVLTDMDNIYNDAGLSFNKYYNKSNKNLSFDNDSQIQFRNLDSLDIHAGKGSRRDILYVNEANRVSYEALDSYIVRTNKYVIFDFNPNEIFYLHEKYVETLREDVDFIILTYKDNEMIPLGEKETIIERVRLSKLPDAPETLKNWVKIFAEGNVGSYSDRRVYNFDVKDIPVTALKQGAGMDFGKSPDRTALIDIYIDGADLYADEVFCMNNLEAEKVQGAERMSIVDQVNFLQYPKGQMIIADSSGRTSILDMRKHGYNVVSVRKTAGGVIDGINRVRSYVLHITPRSVNLKKDLENFFWKIDKNGKIIGEMDGHEPDTVVSIRYALMNYRQVL